MTTSPTAAAPAFDIDDIEDLDTAEVQLKRAGQLIPLFITMSGPTHAKRRQFIARAQSKVQKAVYSGRSPEIDPRADESAKFELIAACTSGWRGFVASGQVLDCTASNVLQLLNDPKRAWLSKAIVEAFDDAENFIRTSANA